LYGLAAAIPKSTGRNKRHSQRFGLPCQPYSILTRAGRGSFVLDFLFATKRAAPTGLEEKKF